MAVVKKIIVKCLFAGILLFVIANLFFNRRSKGCGMGRDYFSISTVTCGPFVEYIPQTGEVGIDTINGGRFVLVHIDELFVSRISAGLLATTSFNNTDYKLQIENVSPAIVDGRFSARMCFMGDPPENLKESLPVRLRIQLGEITAQVLLPVGGFYKDTGGHWVYVVGNDQKAVRRNIVLGRKSGSEYFEVLDGLTPGERVITSTYENFPDRYWFDASDLKQLAKR